jgi:hypothetical protein
MAKAKKIEVEGKEYILAFPTREDAENAEDLGFSLQLLESHPLKQSKKLFHAALLAKQPNTTAEMAKDLMKKFQDDGGDLGEVNSFLIEQYAGFFTSQNGKGKTKRAETIEI